MRDKVVLAAVVALALGPALYVLFLSAGMPHLGRLQDDGLYWLSAKSLAEGNGYRIPSLPDEPFQTKYPPLFPLMLSVVWRVFPAPPGNQALASALTWLLLPLMLLTSWHLFRQHGLGRLRSSILLLLIGWSPAVAYLSTTLMAEMMFACLLLLSLHLAERAGDPRTGERTAFLAGLVGGVAYLAKTAAIPIFLTAPLCLLVLRQRRRAGLFLGGALLLALPWVIWVQAHHQSASDVVSLYYTDYLGYQLSNFSFGRLPSMLWKNLEGLLAGIGGLVFSNPNEDRWLRIVGRVLAVLAAIGLFRIARRTGRLQSAAFTAGYALTLLLWHFPPNERFLLPVMPILLMGLSEEAVHLGSLAWGAFRSPAVPQRSVAVLLMALFLGLCLAAVYSAGVAYFRYFPRFFKSEGKQLAEDRGLYRWIDQNIPPDALLLAYRDTRLALWTGRKAIRLIVPPRLYYDGDEAKTDLYFHSLPEFVQQQGVTHIVVSATDRYSLDTPDRGLPIVERITATDRRFRLLYQGEGVALFAIDNTEAELADRLFPKDVTGFRTRESQCERPLPTSGGREEAMPRRSPS
ncbi:MAG TPA: hypothetical protein VLH09_06350 [Bryobacteraceae bacterium]|nr:hypothetical protein [Bryobacteraceae bacterium]